MTIKMLEKVLPCPWRSLPGPHLRTPGIQTGYLSFPYMSHILARPHPHTDATYLPFKSCFRTFLGAQSSAQPTYF